MFPVLAFEYVPVAVNVTGKPFGVDGASGLMLIPVSTAAVTVRLTAGEAIPVAEAVIVVLPTDMPVAMPAVEIAAIAVFADNHTT